MKHISFIIIIISSSVVFFKLKKKLKLFFIYCIDSKHTDFYIVNGMFVFINDSVKYA